MPCSWLAILKNGSDDELLDAASLTGGIRSDHAEAADVRNFLPRGLMRIDEREPKR